MTPPPTRHVLIVEDDEAIREALTAALELDGHRTSAAATGPAGVELATTQRFDLILLDLMLPGLSGYDVCRRIREHDRDVPILMVTAKADEIDKVLGLELGADDYITKPFGTRELLARVHVALRRSDRRAELVASPPDPSQTPQPTSTTDTFAFAHATIDRKRFTARRDDGSSTELSAKELHLIECFQAHRGEVLSREALLNTVWGVDYLGTTRTLDQHLAQVRKKVEDPDRPKTLKTIHGIGYQYLA
ncbi:response regulator transcription factor [Actomonas aquatica]|uniref:Response regulator transcription factor n=1 Tax=Actomonas aquatica TaxID=2866162 RepID=A0ABZ1C1Z3_9BACT|nr:response regulator transcription factor [Opitutus sp. WL0086]WRQ85677.1 response regulator transcription factor [Opitutus sp. WL0086]